MQRQLTIKIAALFHAFWPHRLVVRTSGSHPGNTGSTPVGAALH